MAKGCRPPLSSALRRALAHYGVRTLDRSPELEESLLWIYKSHQRVEQQIAPGSGRARTAFAARRSAPGRNAEESFRTLLDRMISMTNGHFPAVSDLAREVRYRYFDQPLFERARKQVYDASGRAPCLSGCQSGCRGPPRKNACAGGMSAAAGRACCPAGSLPRMLPCAS